MKKNKNNGWRPVKLEGSVLSQGVEGLIGIEELTDYKLERSGKKTKLVIAESKPLKKEKVIKRKSDDVADSEPVVKKSKVKKSSKKPKKSTNKIVKDSQDESGSESNDENGKTEVVDIEDSSLDTWKTLGVPPTILRALADQKFYFPTTIQSLTIPPAIFGRRDILGAAETGSGKTLAFGIPILNGILRLKDTAINNSVSKSVNKNHTDSEVSDDIFEKNFNECEAEDKFLDSDDHDTSDSDFEEKELDENTVDKGGVGCVRVIDDIKIGSKKTYVEKPLYALILTPTRELAIQIKNHLENAAKYTDIKVAVVVGGMAAVKQERILSKGPEIVIATPGRLWELIEEGNPHLSQLDSVKFLAIDETDRMLERGHFQELHNIIEKINVNESKVKDRQTFVFSATLTLVHDLPEHLQKKKFKHSRSRIYKLTPGQKLQKIIDLLKIKKPKIVDVTKESGTAGNLTECRIACTLDHKDYYLYYFLKRHVGRTLIFCNSIGCVKRLATLFGILECNPLPLHASMQQRQRLKNLERFQADPNGVLIATDVAARGLDIPNVEHVIHYQVPRTSESYVHRSGRTARAQKDGITVLMMEPSEMQYYSKLCKTLGRTQDLPTFPVVDRLLIAVKERVDVAREIDLLELKCRRDNAQKGWLRKAVEDMDLVLDEDETDATMEMEETADLRRQLKAKRRLLMTLLSKPLFPKGFSGKYLDTNLDYSLADGTQRAVDMMKKVIEEIPRKKEAKKAAKKNDRVNAKRMSKSKRKSKKS